MVPRRSIDNSNQQPRRRTVRPGLPRDKHPRPPLILLDDGGLDPHAAFDHSRKQLPGTSVEGIPLPLVSAGGSSLVTSLLGMGVLLNISQHESAEAR